MYHLIINVTDRKEDKKSLNKNVLFQVLNDTDNAVFASLEVNGIIVDTEQDHDYNNLVLETSDCYVVMSFRRLFGIHSYNEQSNVTFWNQIVLSESELVQFKSELSKLSKIKFQVNSA